MPLPRGQVAAVVCGEMPGEIRVAQTSSLTAQPRRQLRSEASAHIVRYRNGRRAKSGRGLAFWFLVNGASIAEVPMDNRDLPFLFNSRSKDFQEITVRV